MGPEEATRTQPLLSSARDAEAGASAAASERVRRSGARRGLGVASVLAMVFFNVSGGPLGSETAVRDGGPLIALASFVGFALLYSLPQALITAELSSAFPDNGGYSLWVDAAFGSFWALQESYWSWFSGVVDSAIYPVILYSAAAGLVGAHAHATVDAAVVGARASESSGYGSTTTPPLLLATDADAAGGGDGNGLARASGNLLLCLDESSCAAEYSLKLLLLLLFSIPNMISSEWLGRSLVILAILVMAPYALLSAVALQHARVERLWLRPHKLQLPKLLSVVYWNLSGFDSVSTFAGEVSRPEQTMPRALVAGVVLMLFSYLVCISLAHFPQHVTPNMSTPNMPPPKCHPPHATPHMSPPTRHPPLCPFIGSFIVNLTSSCRCSPRRSPTAPSGITGTRGCS